MDRFSCSGVYLCSRLGCYDGLEGSVPACRYGWVQAKTYHWCICVDFPGLPTELRNPACISLRTAARQAGVSCFGSACIREAGTALNVLPSNGRSRRNTVALRTSVTIISLPQPSTRIFPGQACSVIPADYDLVRSRLNLIHLLKATLFTCVFVQNSVHDGQNP